MIINQIAKGGATAETYTGETEVTPLRQQETVLPTAGKNLTSNITVNPIPSNYGLVTFTAVIPSAAVIMVS